MPNPLRNRTATWLLPAVCAAIAALAFVVFIKSGEWIPLVVFVIAAASTVIGVVACVAIDRDASAEAEWSQEIDRDLDDLFGRNS